MKIKINRVTKNTLIFFILIIFTSGCKADWLGIVKEATSQLVDKLFSDDDKKNNELSSERLNLYPPHYNLQQAIEPIHKTDLFFLETGPQEKPPLLLIHGLGDLATVDWLNVILVD